MSDLMFFLLTFSSISVVVGTLFSIMFRSIEGHWPRWQSAIVFSLFPAREETAARLVAASIFVEDGNIWQKAGHREWWCDLLVAMIKTDYDGKIKLHLDGKPVPCDARDQFEIRRALNLWTKRADLDDSRFALQLAAQRLSERLRRAA